MQFCAGAHPAAGAGGRASPPGEGGGLEASRLSPPQPAPPDGGAPSHWSPGPFREAACLHPSDAWAAATAPLAGPLLPSISPYRPICRITAEPASAPVFSGTTSLSPPPGRPSCPPGPRLLLPGRRGLCPGHVVRAPPSSVSDRPGWAISGNLSAAIAPIGGPGAARPRDGANPQRR